MPLVRLLAEMEAASVLAKVPNDEADSDTGAVDIKALPPASKEYAVAGSPEAFQYIVSFQNTGVLNTPPAPVISCGTCVSLSVQAGLNRRQLLPRLFWLSRCSVPAFPAWTNNCDPFDAAGNSMTPPDPRSVSPRVSVPFSLKGTK